jgi:prepilin-type N-terminal cleavage/methylation domain-containing protein
MHKKENEQGFSIIELIIVVTIIAILATIGGAFLIRARGNAENGAAFAVLRTISSGQINYYGQHQRYARFDELNASQNGSLGNTGLTTMVRGNFLFSMTPASPTDADLQQGYTVVASKAASGTELPYVIQVDERGQIVQLFP